MTLPNLMNKSCIFLAISFKFLCWDIKWSCFHLSSHSPKNASANDVLDLLLNEILKFWLCLESKAVHIKTGKSWKINWIGHFTFSPRPVFLCLFLYKNLLQTKNTQQIQPSPKLGTVSNHRSPFSSHQAQVLLFETHPAMGRTTDAYPTRIPGTALKVDYRTPSRSVINGVIFSLINGWLGWTI